MYTEEFQAFSADCGVKEIRFNDKVITKYAIFQGKRQLSDQNLEELLAELNRVKKERDNLSSRLRAHYSS